MCSHTGKGSIYMKFRAIACVFMCLALMVGVMSGCEVVDLNEVLVINGEAVTGGEFNFMLDTLKVQIASEMNFDSTVEENWTTVEVDNRKAIDVAKDKAIDEFVMIYVQAQKAEEAGISLTADEIAYADQSFNSYIEQMYGGAGALEEQLKKWQVTKDTLKDFFRKLALATKVETHYVTEDEKITAVTEEELQAQYENVKNEYYSSAITAKHILIMSENPQEGITRTKEEAKAEAQAILDRIKAGEDFEKLMREYSEDVETSFDEGYTFNHNDGQMVQEFDDGAYALEVGEVSELVEVPYGYHIIKRLESNPEAFGAYEDLKEQLKSQIAYDRYEALVMDDWVPNAKVEKNTKALDKIK